MNSSIIFSVSSGIWLWFVAGTKSYSSFLRKFSGLKSECLLITSCIVSGRLGLTVVIVVITVESIMKEKEK